MMRDPGKAPETSRRTSPHPHAQGGKTGKKSPLHNVMR